MGTWVVGHAAGSAIRGTPVEWPMPTDRTLCIDSSRFRRFPPFPSDVRGSRPWRLLRGPYPWCAIIEYAGRRTYGAQPELSTTIRRIPPAPTYLFRCGGAW